MDEPSSWLALECHTSPLWGPLCTTCAKLTKLLCALQFIRGLHSVFVSRWLRHIPRERLLVLRMEDYLQDQQQAIQQVSTWV
jgi:hypothetical protein